MKLSKLEKMVRIVREALGKCQAAKIEAKAFWKFEDSRKRTLSDKEYKDRREAFFHGFWAGYRTKQRGVKKKHEKQTKDKNRIRV